jgi:hypothetical protein
VRLKRLPKSGITLLECLKKLPSSADFLSSFSEITNVVRISIDSKIDDGSQHFSLTIHPSQENILNELYKNILYEPHAINVLDIREAYSGMVLNWRFDLNDSGLRFRFPAGGSISEQSSYMWTEDMPLNEFGFYYTAMFIAGNYARYFPDKWLLDIETSSPLALAIENLIQHFQLRVPLLTLSELSRVYYLLSD